MQAGRKVSVCTGMHIYMQAGRKEGLVYIQACIYIYAGRKEGRVSVCTGMHIYMQAGRKV